MHQSPSPPVPAAAFADAIRLFAALFGAPLDGRDIEAIRQPLEQGALAPFAQIDALRPGAGETAALVHAFGDTEAAVARLNRSYCLLFLGAGGPATAAPYESAYMGSGRLYQEPAGEMAALLQRRGRRPAEDFPEAPDHLVIELALLEETLGLAAAADDSDAMATAEALLARLRRWVPGFAASCRTHDTTGFYAGIAGLLDRLLNGSDPETRV